MAIAVLIALSLNILGCLSSEEMSVSSSADYSSQGLYIKSEETYPGGLSKVTVTLNYFSPRAVSFRLKTSAVDAVAGTDFNSMDKTVTMSAGETSYTTAVNTFDRGQTSEKSFKVSISEVTGTQAVTAETTIKITKANPFTKISGVENLMLGNSYSCFDRGVRRVYCVGTNSNKIFGSGTYTVNRATNLDLDTGISTMSGNPYGNTGCVTYTNGHAACWGNSSYYQISSAGSSSTLLTDVDSTATAVKVSVGGYNTCVLRSDGTIGCQGYNYKGAVGIGTTTPNYVTTRTDVTGLTGPASDVATGGYYFSCALLASAGTVHCWGDNTAGTIGRGAYNATSYPTAQAAALAITGGKAIAAGYRHICAITSTDGVRCWGYNAYAQTGEYLVNNSTYVHTPVLVPGLSSVTVSKIALGYYFSCALTTAGEVYCWGDNTYGQLGRGPTYTASNTNIAGKVLLSKSATKIATGAYHACAVLSDQTVECWGKNGATEADGMDAHIPYPTDLSNLTAVKVKDVAITGGGDYGYAKNLTPRSTPFKQSICAVKEDGGVICWGNVSFGEMGDSLASSAAGAPFTTTVEPTGLTAGTVSYIQAGYHHFCARLTGGGMQCWGDNSVGEIGNNANVAIGEVFMDPPESPTGISGTILDSKTAFQHTCTVTSTGDVYCWGDSDYGQSGTCASQQVTPQLISGISAKSVAVGEYFSCGLTSAGAIKCWGRNSSGVYGNGSTSSACNVTPASVTLSEAATRIFAGRSHMCAITVSGKLYCWGSNTTGQLGQAAVIDLLYPTQVTDLGTSVVKGVAGWEHTCVILTDGSVRCWGNDDYYQLGLGRKHRDTIYKPTMPLGLTGGIVTLKSGPYTTCAITDDGYAKCWGMNDSVISGTSRTKLSTPKAMAEYEDNFN